MTQPYDALLILSFGGPQRPGDVLPFLENVTAGRNVPRQRLLEVAEHYYHFGGRSPLNEQNLLLIAALRRELAAAGIALPIYWGNRNWNPHLGATLATMQADGVKRALVLATSAFGSYSGCRQYREDLQRARQRLSGEAPRLDKLRLFYNHPGFLSAQAAQAADALALLPTDRRQHAMLVFTAHSIPLAQAAVSPYERQLHEACRLVAARLGGLPWQLAYQSRSGPPSQPWLAPDVNDLLPALAAAGRVRDVVVVPIGFLSDHMEVLYDLDTEAQATCRQLGLRMTRAATVGRHPLFVKALRQLIEERVAAAPRAADGAQGPWPDVCPEGCCLVRQCG